MLQLNADCRCGERTHLAEQRLGSRIPFLVDERVEHNPIGIDLVVLVIAVTAIHRDGLQRTYADIERRTDQALGLLHLDMGDVARDAVDRIVMDDGATHPAAAEEIRAAQGCAIALEIGIRLRAAWDVVVAGAADIAVGVNGELIHAPIEQQRAVSRCVPRAVGS